MKCRVEFTLSMPRNNSWNGKWSGAANHYAIVRSMSHLQADALARLHGMRWGYDFGDGWFAAIHGRVMATGERAKRSSGFCGYDWMVDSIERYGAILSNHQAKEMAATKPAGE